MCVGAGAIERVWLDTQNSSITDPAAAATAACGGRTYIASANPQSFIPDGEERDLLVLVVVVSEILSLLGGGISGAVFFCAHPGTRGIRITTKFVDSWSP